MRILLVSQINLIDWRELSSGVKMHHLSRWQIVAGGARRESYEHSLYLLPSFIQFGARLPG